MRDARPPWASKFFRFHAVFGKIWLVHAPPGGFTPPPRENPGSATGSGSRKSVAGNQITGMAESDLCQPCSFSKITLMGFWSGEGRGLCCTFLAVPMNLQIGMRWGQAKKRCQLFSRQISDPEYEIDTNRRRGSMVLHDRGGGAQYVFTKNPPPSNACTLLIEKIWS